MRQYTVTWRDKIVYALVQLLMKFATKKYRLFVNALWKRGLEVTTMERGFHKRICFSPDWPIPARNVLDMVVPTCMVQLEQIDDRQYFMGLRTLDAAGGYQYLNLDIFSEALIRVEVADTARWEWDQIEIDEPEEDLPEEDLPDEDV